MTYLSTDSGWISPEAYCNHVEHWLSIGYDPCPPMTVAELHAALERWPDYARRWLPAEADCIRLGIDPTIDQPVEPLTEREQERLLVTLANDDDFRVAFNSLLMGGSAA